MENVRNAVLLALRTSFVKEVCWCNMPMGAYRNLFSISFVML